MTQRNQVSICPNLACTYKPVPSVVLIQNISLNAKAPCTWSISLCAPPKVTGRVGLVSGALSLHSSVRQPKPKTSTLSSWVRCCSDNFIPAHEVSTVLHSWRFASVCSSPCPFLVQIRVILDPLQWWGVLNEIPLTLSVGWCLLSVIQGSAGKQPNSEEGKTCIMQITNYLEQIWCVNLWRTCKTSVKTRGRLREQWACWGLT